jgi:hypothetical protein
MANWETGLKTTNPNFTGGTLPSNFIGTYGVDLIPNNNYFAINSGDAINNGVKVGSPYNGCINGAGVAPLFTRSQGPAYDIGAYQYTASFPAPKLHIVK